MAIKRAAVINGDGDVVNVIVIDTDAKWEPPHGHTVTHLPDDSPVGPGWKRHGRKFKPQQEAPAAHDAKTDGPAAAAS